jgi:hypothetical protein
MTSKPKAEALFESFCDTNRISWKRVPTGGTRTPDYRVSLNDETVYFEVKQIDADEAFSTPQGISSRTVGSHVRQKIADSRKQVQAGAEAGAPGVLLVYNNLDRMQLFGTETHDFIAAMYGEMTVVLKNNEIKDSYYGRNSLLREGHNTSFSAVGHLRHSPMGPTVRLYENVFACNRLNFASLPTCIEVIRIEVAENAA